MVDEEVVVVSEAEAVGEVVVDSGGSEVADLDEVGEVSEEAVVVVNSELADLFVVPRADLSNQRIKKKPAHTQNQKMNGKKTKCKKKGRTK